MQRHYPDLGENEGCIDGSFGPDGSGISILGGEGRIRRIDFYEPSTLRTRSGIGIGSSEADVQAAYAGHITVEDHPYEEAGH